MEKGDGEGACINYLTGLLNRDTSLGDSFHNQCVYMYKGELLAGMHLKILS